MKFLETIANVALNLAMFFCRFYLAELIIVAILYMAGVIKSGIPANPNIAEAVFFTALLASFLCDVVPKRKQLVES